MERIAELGHDRIPDAHAPELAGEIVAPLLAQRLAETMLDAIFGSISKVGSPVPAE
jgi:hypothetical protein